MHHIIEHEICNSNGVVSTTRARVRGRDGARDASSDVRRATRDGERATMDDDVRRGLTNASIDDAEKTVTPFQMKTWTTPTRLAMTMTTSRATMMQVRA
jgi:hypothetical protein